MPTQLKESGCPHMNSIQAKLTSHAEWPTIVPDESQLSTDVTTITAVQNLWHAKGYNGCIFSQLIATNPEDFKWQKSVIQTVDESTSAEIDRIVSDAVNNPEVRLLSLVFPTLKSTEDLIGLCEMLSSVTETIFLIQDTFVDGLVALSFRIALEDGEVLAWIMGFGPFEFFAETRQSPYTELVIPVKPKPDNTYHRHNQDKDSAHVADQPLPHDIKVLDTVWENTFKKTEKVLGHKPNIFSGARTTLTVPADRWSKKIEADATISSASY